METSETKICGQCVLLFPTHSLFYQFKIPSCPICAQPIVAGDSIHMEPLDDGRVMYSHSECFHFEDVETAV